MTRKFHEVERDRERERAFLHNNPGNPHIFRAGKQKKTKNTPKSRKREKLLAHKIDCIVLFFRFYAPKTCIYIESKRKGLNIIETERNSKESEKDRKKCDDIHMIYNYKWNLLEQPKAIHTCMYIYIHI